MAVHIETGTMVSPGYKSRTLAHLGLVAGMYEELGIGEVIDRAVPQDEERRFVSVGQAVKGMVLNGLGFVNQRLYLIPHFFQDKPTERLLGAGIGPEHLNDDVTGRALDRLYEQDVTSVYALVSMEAVKRLGLRPRCGHLDSTSFHVDGQYNSEHEPEAGVIHITQGYSRDHRPDLNQVVVQLIADNQAGIPLWMEPLSGNSSDKTSFRATVKAHVGQRNVGYLTRKTCQLWVFISLEVSSRFGLGFELGARTLYTANRLVAQFKRFGNWAEEKILKVTTDKLAAYKKALEKQFTNSPYHYLQIVKRRVNRRLVTVKKCFVKGTEEDFPEKTQNTSSIERFNLTLRQHVAYLTRKTLGYCKNK